MELTSDFYLIAAFMVFLTGVSKSGLAAGFGALGVPVLSMFVPPPIAAGILLPIMIVIDTANLWNYRKHFQVRYLILLIPGSMIGITLGTLAFGHVHPEFVRILVGAIALIFAAVYYLGNYLPRFQGKLAPRWGLVFAAVSGFTSHLAHAGGPPMRAYLLNQGLLKSQFVGTFGYLFFLVNLLKLPPYLVFGQISWDSLRVSAALLPMVPLGVIVGMYIHHKLPQARFVQVAYALLTIAGFKLIYDGFSSIY